MATVIPLTFTLLAAQSAAGSFAGPDVNWDRVGAVAILVWVLGMFALGLVVTRRTSNEEKRAIVTGYAAKDEAHAEVVAYKDEQIADLRETLRQMRDAMTKRDEQLALVLDEMAPALIKWSDATQQATLEVVGEGDSHGMGT